MLYIQWLLYFIYPYFVHSNNMNNNLFYTDTISDTCRLKVRKVLDIFSTCDEDFMMSGLCESCGDQLNIIEQALKIRLRMKQVNQVIVYFNQGHSE